MLFTAGAAVLGLALPGCNNEAQPDPAPTSSTPVVPRCKTAEIAGTIVEIPWDSVKNKKLAQAIGKSILLEGDPNADDSADPGCWDRAGVVGIRQELANGDKSHGFYIASTVATKVDGKWTAAGDRVMFGDLSEIGVLPVIAYDDGDPYAVRLRRGNKATFVSFVDGDPHGSDWNALETLAVDVDTTVDNRHWQAVPLM